MNILERLVELIAPQYCFGCRIEGSLLCSKCLSQNFNQSHKLNDVQSSLSSILWCSKYDGLAKELVHHLKFERAKAAHRHIATILATQPVSVSDRTVVVPIVTATSRIRQRGYDQSVLIARAYAKQRGLSFCNALLRITDQRQLGSHRHERLRQMKDAFIIRSTQRVAGSDIILVDDVMTTGATLESAARVLLEVGARKVKGLVFARA